MRKPIQLTVIVTLVAILAMPALADTLVLKSGERISGYFEGGTARVVKFRTKDGVLKDFDILTVQQLQFGDEPQLLSGGDRVKNPTSNNAVATAFTIPTGSKIVIRMVDSINSERNKLGDGFVATLDEPIMLGGLEVVPRNVDIRGRIASINEAGRVTGAAQLGLELTQIVVNGIPYVLTTSEYQEVAQGRGTETAKRAGGGAAVGAIIGAIAGGKTGAAIGAGVGAGGATAVQVMTKGEKLNIPSETKLEFTLRAPLIIAAK